MRTLARKTMKAARLSRNPRWREALKHGVAATIEHRSVDFGGPYATVFDVGGHTGQFTLFALEHFPEAQITTFEPQAEGQAKIREVLGSEPRATLQGFALGAEPGTAELQISKRSDSSSLLPIGQGQVEAFPGTETDHTETITVETLDNLVPEPIAGPALLKIDVQGGEMGVLRGAERTLKSIDSIFVECSFVELYEGQALAPEIIRFLDDRGFTIAGVFGVQYGAGGRCLQADFLFTKR